MRRSLRLRAAERAPPSLRIHPDGLEIEGARYSYVWLRDACTGAASVDPSTRQRLFRTSDVPGDIGASRAEWQPHGSTWRLVVDWDRPLRGVGGQAGQSVFDLDYLARYASTERWMIWTRQAELRPRPWTRQSYGTRSPGAQLTARKIGRAHV